MTIFIGIEDFALTSIKLVERTLARAQLLSLAAEGLHDRSPGAACGLIQMGEDLRRDGETMLYYVELIQDASRTGRLKGVVESPAES